MTDIKVVRTIKGEEHEAVLVGGVWYYTDEEGLVTANPVPDAMEVPEEKSP